RPFLPLNPLRSRVQFHLRNHRKVAVVDGQCAFTGGMNIGDEYLGLSKRFGYWRDSFLRVAGPAAGDLQRVFCQDWEFATREKLEGDRYFAPVAECGEDRVQVARSGPDQQINTIRELLFMGILAARQKLWLAS